MAIIPITKTTTPSVGQLSLWNNYSLGDLPLWDNYPLGQLQGGGGEELLL